MLITPRPPEVHPTRDATWRLMRAVAAWAAFCLASAVATMCAIRRWCALVEDSGIELLQRFARGLLRDLPAITAFFKHRITSGKIESFNNHAAIRSFDPTRKRNGSE